LAKTFFEYSQGTTSIAGMAARGSVGSLISLVVNSKLRLPGRGSNSSGGTILTARSASAFLSYVISAPASTSALRMEQACRKYPYENPVPSN
jgi:hypothetical protein